MAAAADVRREPPLPLLLLHRLPIYDVNLFNSIYTNFTVLDPTAEPPNPSFPELSKSARLMFCLGQSPVTADDLDQYPALECIVGSSAGVNHFDLHACRLRGIRVTNTGEVFSDDVADYAVGLAIDVMRRVSDSDRFVRTGLWSAETGFSFGSKVSGKRIGIVGLGNIGSRVAKRFEGFGCTVGYTSRAMKPNVTYTFYPNIINLASNTDILILCSALTTETHHLVNNDVMRALGKTGVIINVGRGALIDEKELVQFLLKGEIGGAGLDVFENEPHVPEELLKMDNVVLSPHKAVLTKESLIALEELVSSNLKAFYFNEPLQAEIKFD